MSLEQEVDIVACDVDGTLTDGNILISSDGTLTKSFNMYDFAGVFRLMQHDITIIFITNSNDGIIKHRVEAAGLPLSSVAHKILIFEGAGNKRSIMEKFLKLSNRRWNNVAYIGDAANDIECMKLAAYTGCPANAWEEVKSESNYIADKKGGEGCFLEFADEILRRKGIT